MKHRKPKELKCNVCGLRVTNYNYTQHFRKHGLSPNEYFVKYEKEWMIYPHKSFVTLRNKKITKSSIRSSISQTNQEHMCLTNIRFIIMKRILKLDIKGGKYARILDADISWQEKIKWAENLYFFKGKKSENIDYLTVLYNDPAMAQKSLDIKSERVKGIKNPAYDHGGKLSPYSKAFIKYEGLSDEEIDNKLDTLYKNLSEKNSKPENQPIQPEYWMDRHGYNTEESISASQIERQKRTFSLVKCKEKYGEIEGYNIWKDRQVRWQETMTSKSDEEIAEINKKKIYKNGISSKAENELHAQLQSFTHKILKKQLSIKYNNTNYFLYDISIDNKIIEYNGDYWHANPLIYKEDDIFMRGKTAKELWDKDIKKISVAENNGYDVLVIWENDYKNNKEDIINECRKFLEI